MDTTTDNTDRIFADQIKQWCNIVRGLAKQNAAAFTKGKKKPHTYKSGIWAGKTEYMLRDKVAVSMHRTDGDIDNVAFKIPVHGIFREYGVGNGQPRNGRHSSQKHARSTYIRRSPSEWLHDPIDRNIGKFGDLVADYYGDKFLINFRKL